MARVDVEDEGQNVPAHKAPEARLSRQLSGISNLRASSMRLSQDLEAHLEEPLGTWSFKDIDWRFVIAAQHYGTPMVTLAILVALIVVHFTLTPTIRVFFLYDTSISYVSYHGDTIPSSVAVIVPLVSMLISLLIFEFAIFRSFNLNITNAVATVAHFGSDCVCAFITVLFTTEITKFIAGRLRPDFLEECLRSQANLERMWSDTNPITQGDSAFLGQDCNDNTDGRKSFPSGHSSVSCCIMAYNIVYLIWAGYLRADGASFLGLRRQTGWRGGHRFLRELGHGAYLLWILANFAFIWAVGVSRFTDNKHHVSDVLGGWILGTTLALIFAVRSMTLHQYVVLHKVGAHTMRSRQSGKLNTAATSISSLV